jgi:hypothetical protein
MEALKQNVISSKALGFEGMGCIHPRQIAVINQGYAPDETEIEKSKKIVLAFEEAGQKGLGVVALGSKMIDPPVVSRAQKIIDLALRLGKLSEKKPAQKRLIKLLFITMAIKTIINAAGRSVPLEINGQPAVPFKGVGKYRPQGRKYSPPIPTCSDYPGDGNKVVKSLEVALRKCGLRSGMTISPHQQQGF